MNPLLEELELLDDELDDEPPPELPPPDEPPLLEPLPELLPEPLLLLPEPDEAPTVPLTVVTVPAIGAFSTVMVAHTGPGLAGLAWWWEADGP